MFSRAKSDRNLGTTLVRAIRSISRSPVAESQKSWTISRTLSGLSRLTSRQRRATQGGVKLSSRPSCGPPPVGFPDGPRSGSRARSCDLQKPQRRAEAGELAGGNQVGPFPIQGHDVTAGTGFPDPPNRTHAAQGGAELLGRERAKGRGYLRHRRREAVLPRAGVLVLRPLLYWT